MRMWKKLLIGGLLGTGLLGLILVGGGIYFFSGVSHDQKGLKEGVTRSAATDSPVILPNNATDIYYAYELYWQGGCLITRYRLPEGDLKRQAASHLRAADSWITLSSSTRPTIPEHRFAGLPWFQPSSISKGLESDTSGVLWQPKVWIDEENRLIYILDQN